VQPLASFDPTALPPADLLRAALEDPDFRRAQAAARELAHRPEVDLTPLAEALRSPELSVQRRAAQALAVLGERAAPAAGALIEASRDPRWTVREAAVQALGALPGMEAVRDALLQAALHDRVAIVRAAASAALAGGETEPILAALRAALEHPFPRVRCRALRALGRFPGRFEGLLPLFERSLGESHAKVRAAAAEVLGECGPAALPAIPALLRRLRDRDARVQRTAASSLAALRNHLSEPARVMLDRLAGAGSAEENLRAALSVPPEGLGTLVTWEEAASLLDAAVAAWGHITPGRSVEKVRAAAREREVVRLTARVWAGVLARM
jgi:HEAT repeat protein